ncbi:sodium/proline symporter PutP [Agaribacter flavus]|uniref:Sodium/proline symporter n=1 Tax=Agaribacter flavus TaxID=1902781 RepID=A0ABV7FSM5_9ALTE
MSYISLSLYFAAMIGIGVYGYKTASKDISDYVLGGRKVGPKVTALSAGASDMSGWMLMGLPGAMFVMGFDAILIAVGLLMGALANYILVAPRLRVFTENADNALTIPAFFSKRFKRDTGTLRLLSAAVIVVFFTLYTSAGLVAGGKLFVSAFDASYTMGVVVTLAIVVLYTLLGGFLAVSTTDFVQGCIMFVALVMVPVVAFFQFDSVEQVASSAFTSIPAFSESIRDITLITLVSSLAWGLGYFGQPHIIVRFMAIKSVKDIPTAKSFGMSWMLVTILGALATGFIGVAYVNNFGLVLSDPETIFIRFTEVLFHPLISGFLLAAVLAAIMSTISSQLLVSASSLTEDIYRAFHNKNLGNKQTVIIGRLGVAGVAIVALLLALRGDSSILSLVSNAWAGFGAAFGPLILFSLYYSRLTYAGAISGVVSGAIAVLVCIYVPLLVDGNTISDVMYELVPGFAISSITIFLVSHFTAGPSRAVESLYQQSSKLVSEQ